MAEARPKAHILIGRAIFSIQHLRTPSSANLKEDILFLKKVNVNFLLQNTAKWCFFIIYDVLLSSWGVILLSKAHNFFCYQGTTSVPVASSSSSSYWSLWPRKALHSVRGVYKSCWLTVCLVFLPPVLLRLHLRHQEHQHCHFTTTFSLSATIYCEPPLVLLRSVSGTPTYVFWRPAGFRIFLDKPLTHIHSKAEHERFWRVESPLPLLFLISVNLRSNALHCSALGLSCWLTVCFGLPSWKSSSSHLYLKPSWSCSPHCQWYLVLRQGTSSQYQCCLLVPWTLLFTWCWFSPSHLPQ